MTGAGSGIGRAVAARLAGEGARVVGCDVDGDGLEGTRAVMHGAGLDATLLEADVTRQSDVDRVVAEAGAVDVLANVAGIADWFLPVGDVDDETWDRVLAVNATGVMRCCRAVVPGMREAGRGAIVNIASVAGLSGGAGGVAYTASKHAVIGITRSIAFLYGQAGIRCNAVCPGGVDTPLVTGTATPRVPWAWDRMMVSFARSNKVAEPDEIAALVSWLASDEASNLNGAAVTCDGGWMSA